MNGDGGTEEVNLEAAICLESIIGEGGEEGRDTHGNRTNLNLSSAHDGWKGRWIDELARNEESGDGRGSQKRDGEGRERRRGKDKRDREWAPLS